MSYRDHNPLPYTQFNGLWRRGDADACPPDHFTDCANIDFIQNGIVGRFPFGNQFGGISANNGFCRVQVFTTLVSNIQTTFILGLINTGVNCFFYKQKISPTVDASPTLLQDFTSGVNMPNDFELVNINGRAYITFSYSTTGIPVSSGGSGVAGTFATLFLFDGTNFRNAGIDKLSVGANINQFAGHPGFSTPGIHACAFAWETDSGNIGPLSSISYVTNGVSSPGNQYEVTYPVAPGGQGIIALRIFLSRAVQNSNTPADQNTFYFAIRHTPVDGAAFNFSLYDSQLLANANYLLTTFSRIPGGIGIGKYHNRLYIYGFPTQTVNIGNNVSGQAVNIKLNPSTILYSNVNDFETFDAVNGYALIDPTASNSIIDAMGSSQEIGLTDSQEYRDVNYFFKLTKTYSLTDNGDIPATWKPTIIDEGTGAFIKGVATVLDTGGVNYEYLIVANSGGMFTFNGIFQRPEMSWKIADLWKTIYKNASANTNPFVNVTAYTGKNHLVLDTYNKKIYLLCTINSYGIVANPAVGISEPNVILACDYANSFIGDPKFSQLARWVPWTFPNRNLTAYVSLFGWDTGTQFYLQAGEFITGLVFAYNNGNHNEIISSPFIQTNLIRDDEQNVLHLGAIKIRIIGNDNSMMIVNGFNKILKSTNLTIQVFSEDGIRSFVNILKNITLTPGFEPILLMNFLAQKFYLKMSVPDNCYFDINNLNIYVKPTYSGLPG